MNVKKLFKICVTGGPCSGRTTAISRLKERFADDFVVYTVPDVIAMAQSAGCEPTTEALHLPLARIARKKIQLQMDLESFYENIAVSNPKNVVIITNGGVCDHFIGLTEADKKEILEQFGWNQSYLSHERYNLVLHLVTAAAGAEEFFVGLDGAPRKESVEEARALDQQVMAQWDSHPCLVVIDNSSVGFNGKINKAIEKVSQFFGLKSMIEPKKYLLKDLDVSAVASTFKAHLSTEKIDYLVTDNADTVEWVVERVLAEDKFPVFTVITRWISPDDAKKVEKRRIIGERAYRNMLKMKNPEFHTVNKTILSFIVNAKNHTVHTFSAESLAIGEKKITWLRSEASKECIPEALRSDIVKDITDDPAFFTFKLAHL